MQGGWRYRRKPMKENTFYKFIRAFCKPFKLIHYNLNHADHKFQDRLTSWISFIAAAFIIIRCFPYDGMFDLLFTLFGAFVLACACALGIAFIFPYVLRILSILFWIPAAIYDFCDDKINHVTRKKAEKGVKEGARAEVGIKYFIEREKRIKINHAKYLG